MIRADPKQLSAQKGKGEQQVMNQVRKRSPSQGEWKGWRMQLEGRRGVRQGKASGKRVGPGFSFLSAGWLVAGAE